MIELLTQTAKLIPYTKRPRQGVGFVTVFTHEPAPDEPAAKLGSLYIVIEVLVAGRASQEIADTIIETFGEAYYNHAHDQPFPLARFEHAVKETNLALTTQVDKGNAAWIGKLSCVIALIREDEIHITHTGSAEGFLYRGKTHTQVTSSNATRPATPTKTFGSIASGELESGDNLLFSTPALIHNIPLDKLGSVVSNNTPGAAIAELTSLLKGATIDRVAAIVMHVTTPELAALALRTDDATEIQLGAPQNTLQAAKLAATPVAEDVMGKGHKAAQLIKTGLHKSSPVVRRLGLGLAAGLRHVLSRRSGRIGLLIALVIIIVIAAYVAMQSRSQGQASKLFLDYQATYQNYQAAAALPADARLAEISKIETRLKDFQPQQTQIDQLLANNNLANGQPTTFQAFKDQVGTQIQELSGIQTVNPTALVNLASTSQSPSFLESANGKLYVFGTGKAPTIQIINPTTKSVAPSKVVITNIGTIQATTLSSAGDGIFVLTNKPGVWFYKFDTDAITEQTVAYGSWTVGAGIGSYASNLYILGASSIDKYVRSGSGYAPRTQYAKIAASPRSNALAVDGAVHTLSSKGLNSYLGGVLKYTTPIPQAVDDFSHLRSSDSGRVLTATSASSQRIIVFTVANGVPRYRLQLTIRDGSNLKDAVYDGKSKRIFAISNNRIVAVTPNLEP